MADLLARASRVPGLELELLTDTQWATAYLHGKPFATVERARIYAPAGTPRWQAFGVHGGKAFAAAPSARSIVSLVERHAREVQA